MEKVENFCFIFYNRIISGKLFTLQVIFVPFRNKSIQYIQYNNVDNLCRISNLVLHLYWSRAAIIEMILQDVTTYKKAIISVFNALSETSDKITVRIQNSDCHDLININHKRQIFDRLIIRKESPRFHTKPGASYLTVAYSGFNRNYSETIVVLWAFWSITVANV